MLRGYAVALPIHLAAKGFSQLYSRLTKSIGILFVELSNSAGGPRVREETVFKQA